MKDVWGKVITREEGNSFFHILKWHFTALKWHFTLLKWHFTALKWHFTTLKWHFISLNSHATLREGVTPRFVIT